MNFMTGRNENRGEKIGQFLQEWVKKWENFQGLSVTDGRVICATCLKCHDLGHANGHISILTLITALYVDILSCSSPVYFKIARDFVE